MTTKARLAKEGDAFLKSVLHANEDLAARFRELSVCIVYDRADDTFMLTLGEPREALTESLDGSRLYIRIDPDTLKIVGIEIPDFKERLSDDPAVKSIWAAARNVAGPSNSADASSSVAEAGERLAKELRQLIAIES